MHCFDHLPTGYRECLKVDLQQDRRKALLINGAALAATVILLLFGHFFLVPFYEFFRPSSESLLGTFLPLIVMLAGAVAYIILHELTHGAVMKAFGAGHVRFGFTGLYAYAGSEGEWFDRTAYLATSLAPLVVWGVIFTIAMILVPRSWFWVVYFWQIFNITGAAGDIYVSVLTARLPPEVLARDTGVSMTFFLPEKQ